MRYFLVVLFFLFGCVGAEKMEVRKYLLPENPTVKRCTDSESCQCIQYSNMDEIILQLDILKALEGIEKAVSE